MLSLRLVAIAVLCFLPMLVEARRAARHERLQRARGGLEPEGDVYRVMQLAYPGAFLAMLVESGVRGIAMPPTWWAMGLGVFVLGKALKWWAIVTLGESWTFRIIVVPDSVPVTTGPYRVFTHPNYVGVFGELIGMALMTRALVAGPLGVLLFSALMLRRVAVEAQARDAILRRR